MPDKPGAARARGCVFCGIADGRESALFFARDEDGFVDSRRGEPSRAWSADDPDVFVFENQFLFFDLTSLVIPRGHPPADGRGFHAPQMDLWGDLGAHGRVAREHAEQYIGRLQRLNAERAPEGFRVFCNFGPWGEQSQPHAHLQVHAGRELDVSRFAPTGRPWVAAAREAGCAVVHETESAVFYDVGPVLEAGREALWQVTVSVGFSAPFRQIPPLAALAVPRGERTQAELWDDVGAVGADAVAFAEERSAHGYRLMSNFPGAQRDEGWGPAHILVVGGAALGLYADYF